jgi:uncharacterized membrane protein YkoI
MKIIFAAMLVLFAQAQAADTAKKLKIQDLPPAVQQSVKEQSKGATVVGLGSEVENGKTVYELEMKVGNLSKDMMLDAAGKVLSVEEEVTLASIPAGAGAAIQKAVGKGKLLRVETLKQNGAVVYEAQFQQGGKTSEVVVDASGKPSK